MTSAAKIRANIVNARASTGPKSARGRANSAKNALRHALSVSLHHDPVLSQAAEALARAIAGTDADPESRELAGQIADAKIDLRRVRQARYKLLSEALSESYYESYANTRMKAKLIGQCLSHNPPDLSLASLVAFLTATPQGPLKLATILTEELKPLLALDRYERRALSRRKFAIRAFDEARIRKAKTV